MTQLGHLPSPKMAHYDTTDLVQLPSGLLTARSLPNLGVRPLLSQRRIAAEMKRPQLSQSQGQSCFQEGLGAEIPEDRLSLWRVCESLRTRARQNSGAMQS